VYGARGEKRGDAKEKSTEQAESPKEENRVSNQTGCLSENHVVRRGRTVGRVGEETRGRNDRTSFVSQGGGKGKSSCQDGKDTGGFKGKQESPVEEKDKNSAIVEVIGRKTVADRDC